MPKISDAQKQKRIDLILKHAFDLFVENGFLKTSMEDIVQASGVSKGGIYTYFKSKEEIFLTMAENRLVERKDYYKSLAKDMDVEEKLEKIIGYVLNKLIDENYLKGIKFINEFWAIKCNEAGYEEITQRRIKLFSEDIIEVIEEGQHKGRFNKDINPEAMALIIISLIDGSAGSAGIMKGKITEKTIRYTIDMVLNYLK